MGWFARPSRPVLHEALETTIGATSSVQGTLRSDGGARIDGAFEGQIEVAGNVVLGQGARVVADVVARNLTVGGVLHGNADVAGQLQILSTGQLIGDIVVASVMIDEGGVFQGSSRMRGMDQPALPAPRDATATMVEPVRVEPQPDTRPRVVEPDPRPEPARPAAVVAEAVLQPAERNLEDDDFGLDLDRLHIEPVIPDIVIEEVDDPPPTSQRRGRQGRRRVARDNGR